MCLPAGLACRSSAFTSKQPGAPLRYAPPGFTEPLHGPAIGTRALYNEQTDGSPMRHKGRRAVCRRHRCPRAVFPSPLCLSRSAALYRAHQGTQNCVPDVGLCKLRGPRTRVLVSRERTRVNPILPTAPFWLLVPPSSRGVSGTGTVAVPGGGTLLDVCVGQTDRRLLAGFHSTTRIPGLRRRRRSLCWL